jgi:hypothetical protein
MADLDVAPDAGGKVDVANRQLPEGTRVEVRRRFDQGWAQGFEVAAREDGGYLVRRLSDGEVLPLRFDTDDIRRERKRGMWWM